MIKTKLDTEVTGIALAEKVIRRDEGFRKFPYRDTRGVLTIGIGWNLEANGLPEDILEELFRRAFTGAIEGARRLFPTFEHVTASRQMVLVSMVYQLGELTASGFKNFRRKFAAGDYKGAAAEMRDSQWYRQTTDRVERLARLIEQG